MLDQMTQLHNFEVI